MATRYALQHRGTRGFIAAHPSLGVHQVSPDATEAVTWSTATEAELYRLELEEFAGSWTVVPLGVVLNAEGGISHA